MRESLWYRVTMLRSHRLLIAGRALGGLTQAQLAKAAGVSLSVLQAIEQGRSDPKLSTILALLDALKAVGVQLLIETDAVAWGVYVVPGSSADEAGRVQPALDNAFEATVANEPPRPGKEDGAPSTLTRQDAIDQRLNVSKQEGQDSSSTRRPRGRAK